MNLTRKQGKSAGVKELVIQITEHKNIFGGKGRIYEKRKKTLYLNTTRINFREKYYGLVKKNCAVEISDSLALYA